MDANEMKRGYNDTPLLSEMAAGLVTRRYGSVDEAAKAVLNVDGGSNVDRLRRKFREQNWYEIGLSDHVDAEIARRNLIVEPGWLKSARTVVGKSLKPLETFKRARANVLAGVRIKPKDSMVAFSLGATLLLAAVASDMIAMENALLVAIVTCMGMLLVWADKSSETVTPRQACMHLGAFALLMSAVVAWFGYSERDAAFTLGSMQGTLALAAGLTIMGVYATSFVGAMTRKNGTRNSIEIVSLIAGMAIVSQAGTAIMIHDVGIPAIL